MKTLSSELLAELELTVTRPGYLIKLGYSVPLYFSTLGTISWNGNTWNSSSISISGLSQSGNGNSTANININNSDNVLGAIVLNEGAADIPVTVYAVYAGATASGDPFMVFKGVLDGAEITTSAVSMKLVSQANKTLYSPRVYISNITGFSQLQPAGTIIQTSTEKFILTSRY